MVLGWHSKLLLEATLPQPSQYHFSLTVLGAWNQTQIYLNCFKLCLDLSEKKNS